MEFGTEQGFEVGYLDLESLTTAVFLKMPIV
jgi:hypothetical protein